MKSTGDIWDVPPLMHDEFAGIAVDIARDAERELGPWRGKCEDGCRLAGQAFVPGWIANTRAAIAANELGAPVGQALRVAQLRKRRAALDAA
jgi:hypothetical protein